MDEGWPSNAPLYRIAHLGDAVLFFMPGDSIPCAALVIGTEPEQVPHAVVDLVVFDTAGLHFDLSVSHRSKAGNHCYWQWRDEPIEEERTDD